MAASGDGRTSLEERHEAEITTDGKRDVKYPFAFKNLDWDAYHRFRPVYPPSLWAMWFAHHRDRGGRFDAAHDIGAGPGTAAAVLGDHFARVYVSDAGAANLATAEASLGPRGNHYVFHHGPAEQTGAWLPAASIDLSCICMAFHYMDSAATVRAVAQTLRPGGTLAAVTYGFRLLFPGHPRAEALWYAAASRETLRLMRAGRLFPAAVAGLARAMTGLDFVAFPPDLFEPGVRRVYVNVDPSGPGDEERPPPLYFVDPDPALWTEAASAVAPADRREYVRDRAWGRQADAAWLRGFLASCQLGFDDQTWATPEWQELEALVRSQPGGTIAIEWPVSITLATRRA